MPASRLAGTFGNIARDHIANDIVKTMRSVGFDIRERNPLEDTINFILPAREQSPYANRIRLMWQQMRDPILKQFPDAPGLPSKIDVYLKVADEIFVTDAYHYLSIEGYRVSPELIERVRGGEWNPDEKRMIPNTVMPWSQEDTGRLSVCPQKRTQCTGGQ